MPVSEFTAHHRRALFILVVGAVGISFSPVLVKLLGVGQLGPTAIGFWRTIIGAAFLMLLAILRGKKLTMSRHAFFWTITAGWFFFIDLYSWHRSILYVGSGMATVLGNTQVFTTALLSFFIFKERLTPRYFMAAISAIFGVALLVGLFSDSVIFTNTYLRGIMYGLITGVVYGFYIVSIKKAGLDSYKPDLTVMMGWTSLSAAIFLGFGSFFEAEPFWPSGSEAVILLVLLGVFVQALAWLGIVTSLTRLPTPTAALVLLLQPTLAMVWGFLFFDEQLGMAQIFGGVIALSAIYLGTTGRR